MRLLLAVISSAVASRRTAWTAPLPNSSSSSSSSSSSTSLVNTNAPVLRWQTLIDGGGSGAGGCALYGGFRTCDALTFVVWTKALKLSSSLSHRKLPLFAYVSNVFSSRAMSTPSSAMGVNGASPPAFEKFETNILMTAVCTQDIPKSSG
eukprot:gene30852-13417_t